MKKIKGGYINPVDMRYRKTDIAVEVFDEDQTKKLSLTIGNTSIIVDVADMIDIIGGIRWS